MDNVKNNSVKWLPVVILSGGLLFFLVFGISAFQKLLQQIGLLPDGNAKQRETLEKKIENEKAEQYKKQASTKTDAEWLGIADAIHSALYSYISNDQEDQVIYHCCRCKNQTDVYKLIEAFGRRKKNMFGIGVGPARGLIEAVNDELSRKQIDVINNNYERKNIAFRF